MHNLNTKTKTIKIIIKKKTQLKKIYIKISHNDNNDDDDDLQQQQKYRHNLFTALLLLLFLLLSVIAV